jgi:hypothetical protein
VTQLEKEKSDTVKSFESSQAFNKFLTHTKEKAEQKAKDLETDINKKKASDDF